MLPFQVWSRVSIMSKVFLRPRPLAVGEAGDAVVQYTYDPASESVCVLNPDKKRFGHFAGVLSATNDAAYAEAIEPLVPRILGGETACCFAYGHTNSGKTHTIFGYGEERGMYEQAIRQLFAPSSGLLMQVRFYELYNGKVYDLLNKRAPGFVREDADGVIHVRSETTMGPDGEVLVQSLQAEYGETPDDVLACIRAGRRLRAEGTSELHHQSSRSHAVLELEIVTAPLARARQELVVAQSRVVPIGKQRDDLYIAIQSKMYVQGPDGKYTPSGYVTPKEHTDRLAELEAQLRVVEERAAAAATRVLNEKAACRGGMLVFVDLAGAEYTGQGLARNAKEQKEAREINTSLLALKECIRQQSTEGHTPFRNSKLTMLLKSYLEADNNEDNNGRNTIMIATVSSAATHHRKALDTIKYATLVGSALRG